MPEHGAALRAQDPVIATRVPLPSLHNTSPYLASPPARGFPLQLPEIHSPESTESSSRYPSHGLTRAPAGLYRLSQRCSPPHGHVPPPARVACRGSLASQCSNTGLPVPLWPGRGRRAWDRRAFALPPRVQHLRVRPPWLLLRRGRAAVPERH
eukprot:scaffold5055_cov58-Phaeocystis_antarctica.AAC.2